MKTALVILGVVAAGGVIWYVKHKKKPVQMCDQQVTTYTTVTTHGGLFNLFKTSQQVIPIVTTKKVPC